MVSVYTEGSVPVCDTDGGEWHDGGATFGGETDKLSLLRPDDLICLTPAITNIVGIKPRAFWKLRWDVVGFNTITAIVSNAITLLPTSIGTKELLGHTNEEGIRGFPIRVRRYWYHSPGDRIITFPDLGGP